MEHGAQTNLCGIPRCLYQAPEDRNLWQSFTRLSTRPASITTESRGRDTWMRSLSSDHNYQVSPGAYSAPASRCLCRCRWWSARSAGRSHPEPAVTSQGVINTSCNLFLNLNDIEKLSQLNFKFDNISLHHCPFLSGLLDHLKEKLPLPA